MKACLHCGYDVPDDRLRTCPQCGQLLPVEDRAVERSQYISGDLLKERGDDEDVHPYLWGVQPAEPEIAEPAERGDGAPGLLVLGLVVLLMVAALGVLYATGNASWLPGGQ